MSNDAIPATTLQLKKAFDIVKERLRHPPALKSSTHEKRQWAKKLFAELDDADALLEPARPSDTDTVDMAEKKLVKARHQLDGYIEQLKTLDAEDSDLGRTAVEAALVADHGHDHLSGMRPARRSSRIKSKAIVDSESNRDKETVGQQASPKPSVPLRNKFVAGKPRARRSFRIKSKAIIDSDSDQEEGMVGQLVPKSSVSEPSSAPLPSTAHEGPSKERLTGEPSTSKTTEIIHAADGHVKKTPAEEPGNSTIIDDRRPSIVCQFVTPKAHGVDGTRPVWRSSHTKWDVILDSDQDEEMVRQAEPNPFMLSPVETAKRPTDIYEGTSNDQLAGEPKKKVKQPQMVPPSDLDEWAVGQRAPNPVVAPSVQSLKQPSGASAGPNGEELPDELSKRMKPIDSHVKRTRTQADTTLTSDRRPTILSQVVTPKPSRPVPRSDEDEGIVGQHPPNYFVASSVQTEKQPSTIHEGPRDGQIAVEPSKKRRMDSPDGHVKKTRVDEPSDTIPYIDQWRSTSRLSIWPRPLSLSGFPLRTGWPLVDPKLKTILNSKRDEGTVGQLTSPKSSFSRSSAVQLTENPFARTLRTTEELSAGEPSKNSEPLDLAGDRLKKTAVKEPGDMSLRIDQRPRSASQLSTWPRPLGLSGFSSHTRWPNTRYSGQIFTSSWRGLLGYRSRPGWPSLSPIIIDPDKDEGKVGQRASPKSSLSGSSAVQMFENPFSHIQKTTGGTVT